MSYQKCALIRVTHGFLPNWLTLWTADKSGDTENTKTSYDLDSPVASNTIHVVDRDFFLIQRFFIDLCSYAYFKHFQLCWRCANFGENFL